MTASPWRDAPVDLRVEVTPPWPFRIGRGSGDGILRRRGATLMRLLHVGEEPVLVAVAQTAPQRVLFAARSACEAAAAAAIERMRFATGVDDDLRPFYERFADDPVIGRAVRSRPHIRIHRRADPWEALAWSITEQLIELERALVIQRRLVSRLGRRCPHSGLRDMPTPARVAALAPAELQSYDLAARRALALRHAAREIAAGRVDLADRDSAWRRLRRDPEHRHRGRSRCSRSTARATTTASRPATSATSSSSGASPPGTRRRAPTRPRCAASSSATASGRAWPART